MATLRDAFLGGTFRQQPAMGSVRAGVDESIGRERQRAALAAQEQAVEFAPAREERAIAAETRAGAGEERAVAGEERAAKKSIRDAKLAAGKLEREDEVRVSRGLAAIQSPQDIELLRQQHPVDLKDLTPDNLGQFQARARLSLAVEDELEKEKVPTDPQIVQLQNALASTDDPQRRREIQAQINKIGRAAGPLVTIEGDKPAQKGQFGTASVARTKSIIERGEKADATINMVAEMRNSLGSVRGGALDVGALADFRLGLANLAQTFGVTDEFQQEIANAENFQSLSNAVVLAESEAMSGVLSDNDVKFLKSIAPQLDKSGLGNEFLLSRMENVAVMDKIIFDRGREIELTNPDLNNIQVSRKLDDEIRGIPYVGKNLRTNDGVPIFFASFFQNFKSANPDTTIQEASKLFRSLDVE